MLNLRSCVVINSPFSLQAASILAAISGCLGQGQNFYTIFALVLGCAISAAPDKLCWTWGSQEAFCADWRNPGERLQKDRAGGGQQTNGSSSQKQ